MATITLSMLIEVMTHMAVHYIPVITSAVAGFVQFITPGLEMLGLSTAFSIAAETVETSPSLSSTAFGAANGVNSVESLGNFLNDKVGEQNIPSPGGP